MRFTKIIFIIILIVVIAIIALLIIKYDSDKTFILKSFNKSRYNLLVPIYLSPEITLNEGEDIRYNIKSGIVQEFSPKGFLVVNEESISDNSYTCIDYDGKVLWTVLATKGNPKIKSSERWYAPDIKALIDRGKIKEESINSQMNRYSAVRFSPNGDFFGSMDYRPDSVLFSLFKDGTLLWTQTIKFIKNTPFNGKYGIDILVSNDGNILCYIANYPETLQQIPYTIITKNSLITPENLKIIYDNLVNEYVETYLTLTGDFQVKFTLNANISQLNNKKDFTASIIDIYTNNSKYIGSIVSSQESRTIDTIDIVEFSLLGESRESYINGSLFYDYVVLGAKQAIFLHGVGLYKWK